MSTITLTRNQSQSLAEILEALNEHTVYSEDTWAYEEIQVTELDDGGIKVVATPIHIIVGE